jgi:hypothetical protein
MNKKYPNRIPITLERLEEAINGDSCIGFCRVCGEEQSGVEPDAQNYTCESCDKAEVFGAEEFIIMGEIDDSE